ncbi:MAG: hypothetical protein ABL860_08375 [Candidatus Nitrotoga sp.]
MDTQGLMLPVPDRKSSKSPDSSPSAAGKRLLEIYAGLVVRGEHLLQGLLCGQPPCQWHHYPEEDAIDEVSGYQWFYHSHSPEDRPETTEHGHFHLFARRKLWARRLQSRAEKTFAAMTGNPNQQVNTRHLLSIGIDAKGIPVSIFTVNSWVTGDLMLSAAKTEQLLIQMTLDTGYSDIDTVLESVIALCSDEIRQVLAERDATLSAKLAHAMLGDQNLEMLSEATIDLDKKLVGI